MSVFFYQGDCVGALKTHTGNVSSPGPRPSAESGVTDARGPGQSRAAGQLFLNFALGPQRRLLGFIVLWFGPEEILLTTMAND